MDCPSGIPLAACLHHASYMGQEWSALCNYMEDLGLPLWSPESMADSQPGGTKVGHHHCSPTPPGVPCHHSPFPLNPHLPTISHLEGKWSCPCSSSRGTVAGVISDDQCPAPSRSVVAVLRWVTRARKHCWNCRATCHWPLVQQCFLSLSLPFWGARYYSVYIPE